MQRPLCGGKLEVSTLYAMLVEFPNEHMVWIGNHPPLVMISWAKAWLWVLSSVQGPLQGWRRTMIVSYICIRKHISHRPVFLCCLKCNKILRTLWEAKCPQFCSRNARDIAVPNIKGISDLLSEVRIFLVKAKLYLSDRELLWREDSSVNATVFNSAGSRDSGSICARLLPNDCCVTNGAVWSSAQREVWDTETGHETEPICWGNKEMPCTKSFGCRRDKCNNLLLLAAVERSKEGKSKLIDTLSMATCKPAALPFGGEVCGEIECFKHCGT